MLIHEVVGWAIPHIGRKPSYLSPFILHLYKHFECITMDEEDPLIIASEEVAYKLHPTVADSSTSSDAIIPEAPPSSPGSPPPSFRRPNSPPPPLLHHHPEAGPSWDTTWRNVDLSAWDFPENPFKRIHDELEDLQTRYYRLEHITRGANQALVNCGPGNILRELAKRADRKELDQVKKELDQVKMENAHLHGQVATMTQELSQKSEEIRKYHAEQAVVFSRIRELVGHPGKIVNKARLYDHLVESREPVSAIQTIPILVKYSRMMNNMFAEIQKVVPPSGTPQRVYQGPPGSPTGTLYEVVGEVALVQNPPTAADPSQQGDDSRPGSSGKTPEMTRSSQARRKSTGSVRTGRGQSPVPMTSDRSRTPDRARTPIKRQTPDRGKSHAHQASPSSPPDYQMLEPLPTPPSRAASVRDLRIASGGQHPEQHPENDPAPIPSIRRSPVSGTPGSRTPRAEETGDSEDEIAPSPNMRRALTRLQDKASPGTSSLVSGLDIHWKERATPKKPRPS